MRSKLPAKSVGFDALFIFFSLTSSCRLNAFGAMRAHSGTSRALATQASAVARAAAAERGGRQGQVPAAAAGTAESQWLCFETDCSRKEIPSADISNYM